MLSAILLNSTIESIFVYIISEIVHLVSEISIGIVNDMQCKNILIHSLDYVNLEYRMESKIVLIHDFKKSVGELDIALISIIIIFLPLIVKTLLIYYAFIITCALAKEKKYLYVREMQAGPVICLEQRVPSWISGEWEYNKSP